MAWYDYLRPSTWFSTSPTNLKTPFDTENDAAAQWGADISGDQVATALGLGLQDNVGKTAFGGVYNPYITKDINGTLVSPQTAANVLSVPGINSAQETALNNAALAREALGLGKALGWGGLLVNAGSQLFNAWGNLRAAAEARRQGDRSYNIARTNLNNQVKTTKEAMEARRMNQLAFGLHSNISQQDIDDIKGV